MASIARLSLVVLVLAALGCASGPETADSAPLRLYVMDCGELVVGDVSMFALTEAEAGTKDLFVPCYLIEHPQGRLLWDLGLPLTVKRGEFSMEEGSATLERTIEEQLAELGLTRHDVDWVAPSHLHFDHCGQAPSFADRPWLIQRAEVEAAFADPVVVPFYDPRIYESIRDSDITRLDGDHDVFGDGRVVIKSTPGHTPGHQILFVDLAETGPIVLSGDLYHYPANRTLRRPPLFNVDRELTLRSMDETEAFLAETGATLWIEHDAKLAATLRKLPEYYE